MLTLGSKQAKPLSLREGNVNALTTCISMVTQLGVIWWLPSRCLSPTQEAGLGPKVGLDSGSWIRIGNTGHKIEGSRRNNEWLHQSTSNIITRQLRGKGRNLKNYIFIIRGYSWGAISNQGRIRDKRQWQSRQKTKNTKSCASKTQEAQKPRELQGWPPSHDSTEESKREERRMSAHTHWTCRRVKHQRCWRRAE